MEISTIEYLAVFFLILILLLIALLLNLTILCFGEKINLDFIQQNILQ